MSNVKKAALAIGILAGAFVVLIAGLVACTIVARAMFPERWKEIDAKMEASRAARTVAKEKAAAKKTSVADQPGFTMGFLEGSLRKTKGFKKPTSDELDALARKAAYENGVDEGKRSAFVGTYKDAFWHGWSRAK
jgi:hypothetical protein